MFHFLKKIHLLLFITGVVSLVIVSCSPGKTRDHSSQDTGRSLPSGSTGYRIEETEEGYILTVTNPWQGPDKPRFRYILTRKKEPATISWKQGSHISIPVKRVVCTSTTHIAFLKALGKTNHIVGISGKSLVSDSTLRAALQSGTVSDIGYDQQMNYERLVSLQPDAVFLYGVDKQVSGIAKRISELGIPVIMVGDYLEPTLMARLDWILFFAAFFDEVNRAQSYYDSIYLKYTAITRFVQGNKKPTVMAGLPWNEVWFVSGRGSLLANTIEEAGGNYIFSSLPSPEAVPMDIEQVYHTAKEADIWINSGTAHSLDEIRELDPRLGMFRPVKTGRVYNNTKRRTPQGGNDYWESGVIFPDRILADLIFIFHPDVIPLHELYFYEKLP